MIDGLIKCIMDEAGGVVGAIPKRYGLSYFVKCKMILNGRMNMFQCILYQYIESFAFLEVARKGGYSLLVPPLKPSLIIIFIIMDCHT